MKTIATLAATLALAALTACGAGGGSSDQYASATAVADDADCTSAKPIAQDDLELLVTEGVDCTFNGHAMTVNWFKSSEGLDNYRKIADSVGGSFILYGDNFAVECGQRADCDAMQDKVGGEVA